LINLYSNEKNFNNELNYGVMLIFLLSCLLITIKLSAAVFAITSTFLALAKINYKFLKFKTIYIYAFLIGCYLVSIHLLRGVLYSGLPLYPSPIGGIYSLDWSVTQNEARNMVDLIYSWARVPGKSSSEVLASWAWFPVWAQRIFYENWPYIIGCLFLIPLNFIIIFFAKDKLKYSRLFWLSIPLVGSILFWIMTAPDWRFLGAIPQLLIALLGFIFIRYGALNKISIFSIKPTMNLGSLFISIAVLALITQSSTFMNLKFTGWHSIQVAQINPQTTAAGLKLYTPVGDQCWDAPLPCTPTYNNGVGIRSNTLDRNGLESGFNIKNHIR
jgi:hypothetical protein